MQFRKRFRVVTKILLCVLLAFVVMDLVRYVKSSVSPEVDGSGFTFSFGIGSPLAFQSESYTITITPTLPFIGTDGNLTYNDTMGYFDFTVNNGMVVLDFPTSVNVTVDGAIVDSGSSHDFSSVFPSHHVVAWGYEFVPPVPWPGDTPFLDFMFIFGIIGLLCMFGGPLYGISKFKKKEYRDGAIVGLIFFVIGFALFIAWLWSS